MKKMILLISLLVAVNMNAKSRSEMIRQDLSKLGVSQEIILKTIELDKEIPNVVSEPNREKVKNLALKIEALLKKPAEVDETKNTITINKASNTPLIFTMKKGK